MKILKWKHFWGIVLGAAAGYGLSYAFRCAGGTCPLSHNPWIGIGFGALAGLILIWDPSGKEGKSPKKKIPEEQSK